MTHITKMVFLSTWSFPQMVPKCNVFCNKSVVFCVDVAQRKSNVIDELQGFEPGVRSLLLYGGRK